MESSLDRSMHRHDNKIHDHFVESSANSTSISISATPKEGKKKRQKERKYSDNVGKLVYFIFQGSFYSTVESVGLFYRYVTPVHPWILYLLYSESPNVQLPSIDTSAIGGASASLLPAAASNADLLSPPHVSPTFFTVFLCILYVIFKINQIYNGLNEVVRSLRELLGNFVSFFFSFF